MLSLAERTGIGAYAASVWLLWNHSQYSAVPLAVFVMLCLIAPFMTSVGFFLPIISRGNSGKNGAAITFDDGPDPQTTPALLHLLATHHVKAAFFVTGKNASDYPELIRNILDQGHAVGNHSYHHDPFVMLKRYQTLRQEIGLTQNVLKQFGIVPLVFRPPAGVTNPKLKSVLSDLNLSAVNFSCRARDGGNRRIRNLSETILRRVRPDDIVLLHDRTPKDPSLTPFWLREIEKIISGIRKKGLSVLPLEEIIGKPVHLTIMR